MGGCTNCGQKGGCDTRKHGMFAAIEEALNRLYPAHRWGERDEVAAWEGGLSREEGEALAHELASRLKTSAFFQPGDASEWCDYIYVLCLGRSPSIAELRGGAAPLSMAEGDLPPDAESPALDERYLRVALSSLARFVAVQEVAMTLERRGDDLVITERPRSGVFDPVLLPRFQALVAVLADFDIRHIDFGEIMEPPPGFADAPEFVAQFGCEPVVANYLFYPQPPTTVSTMVVVTNEDDARVADVDDALSPPSGAITSSA